MATEEEIYRELPPLVDSSESEDEHDSGQTGHSPDVQPDYLSVDEGEEGPDPLGMYVAPESVGIDEGIEDGKKLRVRFREPSGHKVYCDSPPEREVRLWCYPLELSSFPNVSFRRLSAPDVTHGTSRQWANGEVILGRRGMAPVSYEHRDRIRKLNNPAGWARERRRGIMMARSLRNYVLNEMLTDKEGIPSSGFLNAQSASTEVWQKQLRSMGQGDNSQSGEPPQ